MSLLILFMLVFIRIFGVYNDYISSGQDRSNGLKKQEGNFLWQFDVKHSYIFVTMNSFLILI